MQRRKGWWKHTKVRKEGVKWKWREVGKGGLKGGRRGREGRIKKGDILIHKYSSKFQFDETLFTAIKIG